MRQGRTPSELEKEKILNAVFSPLEMGPSEESAASPQIGSTGWLDALAKDWESAAERHYELAIEAESDGAAHGHYQVAATLRRCVLRLKESASNGGGELPIPAREATERTTGK